MRLPEQHLPTNVDQRIQRGGVPRYLRTLVRSIDQGFRAFRNAINQNATPDVVVIGAPNSEIPFAPLWMLSVGYGFGLAVWANNGQVWLSGTFTRFPNTGIPANDLMFTLPARFRPQVDLVRIHIQPNGYLRVKADGRVEWISPSSIIFVDAEVNITWPITT